MHYREMGNIVKRISK